jgi:hypothetical protein
MQADDFLNGQVLLIDKPLTWSSFQTEIHFKTQF